MLFYIKEHIKGLKTTKKTQETRIEEESMDHGKDPHLLLMAFTVMLITGLLAKFDYLSYVCGGMIRTIWLGLAE